MGGCYLFPPGRQTHSVWQQCTWVLPHCSSLRIWATVDTWATVCQWPSNMSAYKYPRLPGDTTRQQQVNNKIMQCYCTTITILNVSEYPLHMASISRTLLFLSILICTPALLCIAIDSNTDSCSIARINRAAYEAFAAFQAQTQPCWQRMVRRATVEIAALQTSHVSYLIHSSTSPPLATM